MIRFYEKNMEYVRWLMKQTIGNGYHIILKLFPDKNNMHRINRAITRTIIKTLHI